MTTTSCHTRRVRRRSAAVTVAALAALALLAPACSDDGGDVDAFCATARRFSTDNPAAAFAQVDPNDPVGTSAALQAAADQLSAWADDAPGDVRGSVQALADAATTLAGEFTVGTAAGVEGDDGTPAVDTAVVEAASAEVLAFTRDRCEVDLDPAG